MSDQDQERAWKLVKIGVLSTLVSIPLGVWSMKNHSPAMTAVLLTGIGYAVKRFMLEDHGNKLATR